MAQYWEILHHVSFEGSQMISEAPFYESDKRTEDEPNNLQVLTFKPEVREKVRKLVLVTLPSTLITLTEMV
jgi:hypothetical protein